MELQGSELQTVLLTLLGLTVFLLISHIWLWLRVGRMRKRYKAMMNGMQAGNVEELLITVQNHLNDLKGNDEEQRQQIEFVLARLQTMKSNMGFIRYNAFAHQGNDLSFSLAILDEGQNGVVLTGIQSRDDSYLYAKPVERGQSSYALSPEEKTAIGQVGSRKHSQ